MKDAEIQAKLEAMLFASGESVPVKRLADVLEISESKVTSILESMRKKYEDDKIIDYMALIYETMDNTIKRNLFKEELLPGSLKEVKTLASFSDRSKPRGSLALRAGAERRLIWERLQARP